MKLIILLVCQLGFSQVNPQLLSVNLDADVNGLLSSKDNGVGSILSNETNLLPNDLLGSVTHLITVYPFELIAKAVNALCSKFANSSDTKVDVSKLAFELRTTCKKISFPILNADEMWKSPEFNRTKKTVILVTGFLTTVNSTVYISKMAKAYNCRGDVNFIAVDTALYLDTLYIWSALNAEQIGKNMGRGLVQLSEITPLENIHLIGHSLGAHIVGYAGRIFKNLTGKQLPRITGLDPAGPCFEGKNTLKGLSRGDAQFIDIIHTNPGVFGYRDPIGDVDFYTVRLNPLPTGCLDVVCAHLRALSFYTESVYPGNEDNFIANSCSSLEKLKNNECSAERSSPMGYATPKYLRGNYSFDVNALTPFGKNGSKTREEKNEKCGLCENNDGNSILNLQIKI